MSTSSSNKISNDLRKNQDEQNAKAIRELSSINANKYCFECGQRGPTWVNVSEGAFVCMMCAGLLRGLNPPHRVKSISMSTFTQEEIEKLRNYGNEENSRIWLGLYDGQVKFQPRDNDEVKHYLIQKYENKKWYVSPGELEQQRKLLAAATVTEQQDLFFF